MLTDDQIHSALDQRADLRLSNHFTLVELCRTNVRANNWPGSLEVVRRLERLCLGVLEPVRVHFGRPVHINSGYRSPAVNRAVKGSATSQHLAGEAADLEITGVANADVATWIRDHVAFDQLILEFYTPGVPNSGWVHVSLRAADNRHQVLTAARVAGRTSYRDGLVA